MEKSPSRLATLLVTNRFRLGHRAKIQAELQNGRMVDVASFDAAGGFALEGNTLQAGAGTGITSGTGTVYESGVEKAGGVIRTSILLDLTGLRSTAGGDIIGVDGTSLPCHLGQITAARCGTIMGGKITCLETPAGGDPDVDFYAAVEGTGNEDAAITGLDETQLIDHGDWTAGDVDVLTAFPDAGEYLYAVAGATTNADYTAGKFLIELYGA